MCKVKNNHDASRDCVDRGTVSGRDLGKTEDGFGLEYTSFVEQPVLDLQQMMGSGKLEPRRQKFGSKDEIRANNRPIAGHISQNWPLCKATSQRQSTTHETAKF